MEPSKQFFKLKPVQEALKIIFDNLQPISSTETHPISKTVGRVVAVAPHSPMDLPTFHRSAMDGYAVKAADTFGASDALPAYLQVVGDVKMGEVPTKSIQQGDTMVIHTGAMVPDGADAVVMVERTQAIGKTEIEVLAPVAIGENIIKKGEDIRTDAPTIAVGHVMRPQDIGALLAVGITQIEVRKRLKIAVLSSGDELVHPDETPQIGQIRDINSHMLAALLQQTGADVQHLGIAHDTLDSLLPLAKNGFDTCDMLVLSAGSSVSVRDLTGEVIQSLGKPGILQHGLAVKPGKPTILAVCNGKPVIGLPGNPVSALLVARQVILPIMRYLTGEIAQLPMTLSARLTQNIASSTGREDSVPVRVEKTADGYQAVPIWGKSNLIFTLLRADGLVHVPLNISGYTAGTLVNVSAF